MNQTIFLEKLKSGDEQAFKHLFDTFREKVFNTSLGFVHNTHDAEDVTQDVFVEIYRSIGQFREQSTLSTWVYRVTVSKCLALKRHRGRQKRGSFFQSLIGLDNVSDNYKRSDFNHPGVQLENKERTEVMLKTIDKLSDNQKIAFTLHKIEGLSYKEISDIMELSLSSVESLIFRARRNLKKKLTYVYKNQII